MCSARPAETAGALLASTSEHEYTRFSQPVLPWSGVLPIFQSHSFRLSQRPFTSQLKEET